MKNQIAKEIIKHIEKETFKEIEDIILNEKLRPMITDGLIRMGYINHQQGHGEIDVDNSIMAKDFIKIIKDITLILKNRKLNEKKLTGYQHKK